MAARTLIRRLLRIAGWLLAVLLVVAAAVLADAWKAIGHRPTGARLARMQRSPQWRDDHFENPQPLVNYEFLMLRGAMHVSRVATPSSPLPVVRIDPAWLRIAPATGLRITWLGHATTLVEIDGIRILTDPVWSERSSPLSWFGPRRYFEPPIALQDLPHIDAVVISHDHYDHLDYRTIVAMRSWKTMFLVPLGVGAHLEYWGIPRERIVELDWWETTRVGSLTIVCTPARHASGRQVLDKDRTLWAGYALVSPRHRVYFSGDTGFFPAMNDIGARLGPFDATMIEIGQYGAAWPDWHIGPERAVEAHLRVRGRVLLPVHWALFTLAYHGWTEPMERLLTAAQKRGVTVVAPRPGQPVEPDVPAPLVRWWPSLPWQTESQSPLASTGTQ